MDAFSPTQARIARHCRVIVACVAVVATVAARMMAMADEPAATAGEGAAAFQPGELSIGEPVALPFGPAAASAAPADDPRATSSPVSAGEAAVPGSGWLGLAVAESPIPGRWRVEEVTAGGPAARAGIVAGDELRAVNGSPLANAEQVSQALATIAAGQDVRVAVARADRVSEVVLRAESRPPPRGVQTPPAAPQDPPSAFVAQPATPLPAATDDARRQSAVGPAEWRSAPGGDEPATGSRFGRGESDAMPAAEVAGGGGGATPGTSVIVPPSFSPAPAASPATGAPRGSGRTALGVRTVPIDSATQARFRLTEPSGAYVIGVVQELPAGRAGVPPGSVIVALGGEPVRSPAELTRLVTSGPVDRPVPVQFVLPGGESKQANVVLQPLETSLEQALVGEPAAVAEPPRLAPGPAPRRAERPAANDTAIRAEIREIRSRLEILERLLEPVRQR